MFTLRHSSLSLVTFRGWGSTGLPGHIRSPLAWAPMALVPVHDSRRNILPLPRCSRQNRCCAFQCLPCYRLSILTGAIPCVRVLCPVSSQPAVCHPPVHTQLLPSLPPKGFYVLFSLRLKSLQSLPALTLLPPFPLPPPPRRSPNGLL